MEPGPHTGPSIATQSQSTRENEHAATITTARTDRHYVHWTNSPLVRAPWPEQRPSKGADTCACISPGAVMQQDEGPHSAASIKRLHNAMQTKRFPLCVQGAPAQRRRNGSQLDYVWWSGTARAMQ